MIIVGITQRQERILESIVRDYIDSARPVPSRLIAEKYEFGLSAASIRTEMQALTSEDYLFQPHTSAGRVPTDKGYKFLVRKILKKEQDQIPDSLEQFLLEQQDIFQWTAAVTKFLSETCSALVVSCLKEQGLLFKEGWRKILKEPEFEDQDFTVSFTEFLEDFEKEVKKIMADSPAPFFRRKNGARVKIFIGKESPFKKSDKFSIILTDYQLPPKKKGIISIVGPKRMPYPKNINLMHALSKYLEQR